MRAQPGRGRRRDRLILLIAIALLTAFLLRIITDQWLPEVHNLEMLAYDWHMKGMPPLKPDPRLVLVGMNDGSLSRLKRTSYPLPRRMHGQIVEELHRAGARVIGFDMWFTGAIPDEDRRFAAAIGLHGKIVAALMSETKADRGEEQTTFTPPAPLLRPYIRASSLLVQRTFGNTVRSYLPYPPDAQTSERHLHMAVSLAAAYYGVADATPVIRDTFDLGPLHAPIGEKGEMLFRYIGPKGSFPYVPYADVYDGSWRAKRGPDFFRDKIVLVGIISDFTDRQNTPQGDMQGVEIMLNATQTLLQHNWIRPLSKAVNVLVQFALCLVLSLAVWRYGIGGGGVCFLATVLLWTIWAHRLFAATGLWIDTVEPLGAMGATFFLTSLAEIVDVRRKFSRFMPKRDAAFALRTDNLEAHTTEQEAAIVFADIRQYTNLSETLPSETVERLLQAYFLAGEQAAQEYGGDVDKFVGDELMVRFDAHPRWQSNVPRAIRQESYTLRAVRWALAMQEFAAKMDSSGLAGAIGFRIGIGLSAGTIRIGMVGARDRLQATAIGDAVNVASRLQEATKTAGRPILMSHAAYLNTVDRIDFEPMGELSVRGKQAPQAVYYPIRVRNGD